jgi:hypothetical protein
MQFAGLAVLLCCSTAGVTALAGNGEQGSDMAKAYELTLSSPTLEQSIGPDIATPSLQKFVQIEVSRVNNPQRIALSFTLHFQPARGEPVYLGTFSLFPPDNPGKFIVATRGMLQSGGTVSVTLVPLQQVTGEQEISAWIKPLTFLGE